MVHKLEEDKVYRHFIERTRLGHWQKFFLYSSVALLWFSGAIWVGVHYLNVPAPLGPLMMKIHGAAAMAALLVLGALISAHIRRGWALRRNRLSGTLVTGAFGFLVATGWILYYVAGERLRDAVSVAHWALGLALPFVIYLHILMWKWEQNRP